MKPWLTRCVLLLVAFYGTIAAAADARYELSFPDLPEQQTLACDFHMHTVFSDGAVWPTVRVAEAWRQGLHALAITDHIEYQPKKADVPTQHNRPYEIATGDAKARGLMLIRGAEITRDTPPGHFNAIFLDDVRPLETPEFVDAIKKANEQNAFVFWNHQGWKGEEKGRWLDVHTELFDQKLFQGMEICNGNEYFPTAHKWCLEKNLTMLGNTDIHDADTRLKSTAAEHRTLTLVFVKERTPAGLKDALKSGRTLVWYKDQLIGREEWLRAMFAASVRVGAPTARAKTTITVEIRNACDADVRLAKAGGPGPAEIVLPARATSLVRLTVPDGTKSYELSYTASNWLVAPEKGLPVTLKIE